MKLPELGIIIAGSEPHMSISSAIEAAKVPPGAMVWIPAHYTGEDAAPPSPEVPVIDCRNGGSQSYGTPSVLPAVIDCGTF